MEISICKILLLCIRVSSCNSIHTVTTKICSHLLRHDSLKVMVPLSNCRRQGIEYRKGDSSFSIYHVNNTQGRRWFMQSSIFHGYILAK
jgi:hypothetical protein